MKLSGICCTSVLLALAVSTAFTKIATPNKFYVTYPDATSAKNTVEQKVNALSSPTTVDLVTAKMQEFDKAYQATGAALQNKDANYQKALGQTAK